MYNRHRYCWQQSLNSKRLQMPRSFLVLFPPVSLALDSMLRPVPFPPPPLSLYLGAQSVFGRGYEYPFFGEEGKICSEKERIAKIIRIESFRIFRLYRSIFSPERLKCTNTCIYIYMGRAFLPLVFCFSLLRTYPLIRRDTRVHNARYT